MTTSNVESLARTLERNPSRLPAFHDALVDSIDWLMDATCAASDPDDRARLACMGLLARGVLERFRLANVN